MCSCLGFLLNVIKTKRWKKKKEGKKMFDIKSIYQSYGETVDT